MAIAFRILSIAVTLCSPGVHVESFRIQQSARSVASQGINPGDLRQPNERAQAPSLQELTAEVKTVANASQTALSSAQIQSKFPALAAAAAISTAIVVLEEIAGVFWKLNRRWALQGYQFKENQKIEKERMDICELLSSLYDASRFQLHGLRSILEALVGKQVFTQILDPNFDDLDEKWEPWREIMSNLEKQVLQIFNTLAGKELCRGIHVETPDLRLAARRVGGMIKFPHGRVTASSQLIMAGKPTIDPSLPQHTYNVDFVSRFFKSLEADPIDMLRSGPLYNDKTGKTSWWSLSTQELTEHPDDIDDANIVMNMSALQPVVSHRHGGRHCMKLQEGDTNHALCADTEKRLQEWLQSLNFHRCNFQQALNSSVEAQDHDCAHQLRDIKKVEDRSQWEKLGAAEPKLPDSLMLLPWHQRSFDADMRLQCETNGKCTIAQMLPMQHRKTGVLLWKRDKGWKAEARRFFLLRDGSLSWYESVGSKTVLGEISVKNLLMDKLKLMKDSDTCFAIECHKNAKHKRFIACALTKDEADSWMAAIRTSYAKFLGVEQAENKESPMKAWLKKGKVMTLFASKAYYCEWEEAQMGLQLDQLSIGDGVDDDDDLKWRLASVKPETLKFSTVNNLPTQCRDALTKMRGDSLSGFAQCFSFKSDGVLFEEGEHTFCDVDTPHNTNGASWKKALSTVLERYHDEDQQGPHREKDDTWGQHLLNSPVDSPHLKGLLNKLLDALPNAQHTGSAVLCPPKCICPKYSAPWQWADVSPVPQGTVSFEVRSCHEEEAELRNVRYQVGYSDEAMIEVRLRGFTLSQDQRLSALGQTLPSALVEGDATGYSKVQGKHRCDAPDAAEDIRLLWRFVYTRDGEALSKRVPAQHGKDAKPLVGIVLRPLVTQYLRETKMLLPGFKFGHGFENVFDDCPPALLWKVLKQVEREELLLVNFFGGSAFTKDRSNKAFHQRPLDPQRAMLVASEFWRSSNEHGCANVELWHPITSGCYTFCRRLSGCTAVKQRLPGARECPWNSMLVKPSNAGCQETCRTLLPGNPGCELADPAKLPDAVEDFYKDTKLNPAWLNLAFNKAPMKVLVPAYKGLAPHILALQDAVLGGMEGGLAGLTGALTNRHALRKRFLQQPWTAMAMQTIQAGTLAANIFGALNHFYGMYVTYKKFQQTKIYFNHTLKEERNKLIFVKCQLFESLHSSSRSLHENIIKQAEESPELFKDINSEALITSFCSGPLPRGLTASDCESTFRAGLEATVAGDGTTKQGDGLAMIFLKLTGKLAGPANNILEEEVTKCEKDLPPATQDRHVVPISSLKVLWYNPLNRENDADRWFDELRARSNVDFEPVRAGSTGQKVSFDVKMGVTAPLKTVLLAVRDPAAVPLADVMVNHLSQTGEWNSRVAQSTPSKYEYDMAILSSMKNLQPVGLAVGGYCLRKDKETQDRCALFSKRFEDGADYEDSLRAGGFVDVGMSCASHWSAGRGLNETLVFANKQEISLATRSGIELPPIVDVRVSKEQFSEELSAQGFIRVPMKHNDLNKGCAAIMNVPSYLYTRREWVSRPTYIQTMAKVKQVKQNIAECLEEGVSVPLGPPISMGYGQRCVRCKKQSCDSDGTRCRTLGLIDGYLNLGWSSSADSATEDGDGAAHRKRIVYVGEIVVNNLTTSSGGQEPVYACEASGVGSLWAMSQSLEIKQSAGEKRAEGTQPGDIDTDHAPPAEADLVPGTVSWIGESNKSFTATWRNTPRSDDFYFVGEVHQYGDAAIFEQNAKVPTNKASTLMCKEWEQREASLRIEAEKSLVGDALTQLCAAQFRACLDEYNTKVALKHCFAKLPCSKEDLQKYLIADEGTVASSVDSLVESHRHQFPSKIVAQEQSCSKSEGFVEEEPSYWSWPTRKLAMTREELLVESCVNGDIQTIALKDASLLQEVDLKKVSTVDECFTLIAARSSASAAKKLKLCAPMKLARSWRHMIGQAIIDANVGSFPARSVAWLNAAKVLKCPKKGEERLPGKDFTFITLEERLLPDGFGKLWVPEPSCGDSNCGHTLKWLNNSRGKFTRGVKVGLHETRVKIGLQETPASIGRFQRGVFAFGTSVVSAKNFRTVDTIANQVPLFGNDPLVYTGCWLETQDGKQVPAHIGALHRMDDKDGDMHLVYSGQFALQLPWGLGTWVDHQRQTTFRGLLKKEYKNSHFIRTGEKSAEFVPLMIGELTRTNTNIPIRDDEVLKYHRTAEHLPSHLLHTKSVYFAGAKPTQNGKETIVCKSKALFQWKEWIAMSKRLGDVWKAIEQRQYLYFFQVTAHEEDVYRPERDVDALLAEHTDQLKGFRKHLQTLKLEFKEDVEKRLKDAVQILTESLGGDFTKGGVDPLRSSSKAAAIAKKLQKVGSTAYMRFQSVASLIEATDEALEFASASYCMLCTEKPQDPTHKGPIPELDVVIQRGRGFPQSEVGKNFAIKVSVWRDGQEISKDTRRGKMKRGLVDWNTKKGHFAFSGMQLPMDNRTKVKFTLLRAHYTGMIRKKLDKMVPVATWTRPLMRFIGRRLIDYNWVKLEPLKNSPMEDQDPVEVRVAFMIRNIAGITGIDNQHVLPAKCGATYTVRRFIERNAYRLRKVEAKVQTVLHMAADLADRVKRDEFLGTADFDPRTEGVAPDPVNDPPAADVEGSVHKDVFGDLAKGSMHKGEAKFNDATGGLLTKDGPSVTPWIDENPENQNTFQGPQFFAEYVKLSNPAY